MFSTPFEEFQLLVVNLHLLMESALFGGVHNPAKSKNITYFHCLLQREYLHFDLELATFSLFYLLF